MYINYSTITTYFEELKLSLEGIAPDCIINYDDTNITDDPSVVVDILKE